MQNYAIIVAGGSGSRMGSEIPKQFLQINKKPILFHTIEKFLQITDLKVILVLPKKDIQYWDSLEKPLIFQSGFLTITEGGASRFQSVKNGLELVPHDADLVAVHDGVRPLVSLEIIQKSFDIAAEKGSAVTSVMLKDSARRILENGDNEAIDRTKYRLMQTPQTFDAKLMKSAFETPEQSFFTDCASVLEYAGYKITLIEGSYENIKITTPEDLILAEAFLNK